MHELLSKVRDTIQRESLLDNTSEVIVAISGGADSVALLMALIILGYKVSAAHCNFNLRGEESNSDEQFVISLCDKLGVKLDIIHFNTVSYSEKNSISIEMAARELRYYWFRELSENNNNCPISIAHNSDDNIETTFLNLASGTGLRGLTGMPYKRNGYIIRPLLDCSREDIISFLRHKKQNYIHDSSNDDTKYKRNFIRHNIIPLFEELNKSFRRTMSSNISILDFNKSVYDIKIKELRNNIIHNEDISVNILRDIPLNKLNLLYELLIPYNFTVDVCKSMVAHINKLSSGKEFLSSSHKIITYSDIWQIIPLELFNTEVLSINIDKPSDINIPMGLLSWDILDVKNIGNLNLQPNEAIFDYDRLTNINRTLDIRPREEADYIKPYGMNGYKKKISRILIDGKYSPRERLNCRVLSITNKPIWLIGIKSDSTFKVTSDTKRIIKFYFRNC